MPLSLLYPCQYDAPQSPTGAVLGQCGNLAPSITHIHGADPVIKYPHSGWEIHVTGDSPMQCMNNIVIF